MTKTTLEAHAKSCEDQAATCRQVDTTAAHYAAAALMRIAALARKMADKLVDGENRNTNKGTQT